MIQHVDDIILTCAALSKLKPKLIKTKGKDSQKELVAFIINYLIRSFLKMKICHG